MLPGLALSCLKPRLASLLWENKEKQNCILPPTFSQWRQANMWDFSTPSTFYYYTPLTQQIHSTSYLEMMFRSCPIIISVRTFYVVGVLRDNFFVILALRLWRLPGTSGSGYDIMQTWRHDFDTQDKQNWSESHRTNNVTSTMQGVSYIRIQHMQWFIYLRVPRLRRINLSKDAQINFQVRPSGRLNFFHIKGNHFCCW